MEARVENGDPRDVICQMTEQLGADVLVMGSHGYGLIKRWVPFYWRTNGQEIFFIKKDNVNLLKKTCGICRAFLGSVSNHCAQNVKCPVLIVKKPKTNAGSK